MTRRHESPLWAGKQDGKVELPPVGAVLKEFRKAEGLTQRDLAVRLQVDQSYVSKIESGVRPVRDVGFLAEVAKVLAIPPSRLGLSDELLHSVRHRHWDAPASPDSGSDPVERDQAGWRRTRRYLNQHRHELARRAVGLYPAAWQIGKAPLLAPAEWHLGEPVSLERVQLTWTPAPFSAPLVLGAEPETNACRPLRAPGEQYDRYTSAVRYIDAPTLFENRPSYRLLNVELAEGSGRLAFGLATYFDKLDVAEALGHELAAFQMKHADRPVGMSDLPFRSLVGDPFDANRRHLLPAITTLTLRRQRRTGRASFLLHWRDPTKVATAAGIYDVIPAGEFQPSSLAHWDQSNDFDLWRNIVREFSEELLGTPEHDGTRSSPIDYDAWNLFRRLQAAREAGQLFAYCLAVAVDALTLAPTILSVIVIDDELFDDILREAVMSNAEGIVVAGDRRDDVGFPFDEPTVRRFIDREPMASPGAGCLELAWRHRIALLSS